MDHGYLKKGPNVTSCDAIFKLCRSMMIDLDLTAEECLEDHGHDNETSNGVSEAEGIYTVNLSMMIHFYNFL